MESDGEEVLRAALRKPTPDRVFQIKRALVAGMAPATVAELTRMDPWFVSQLEDLIRAESEFRASEEPNAESVRRMKRLGFSDRQLGALRGLSEEDFRALSPLIHNHVTPYGSFELDLEKRLPLDAPVALEGP